MGNRYNEMLKQQFQSMGEGEILRCVEEFGDYSEEAKEFIIQELDKRGITPPKEYYYLEQGKEKGPYSKPEMHVLAQNGAIKADTYIKNSHMEDWQAAGSVEGLLSQAHRTKNVKPFDPEKCEMEKKRVGAEACLKAGSILLMIYGICFAIQFALTIWGLVLAMYPPPGMPVDIAQDAVKTSLALAALNIPFVILDAAILGLIFASAAGLFKRYLWAFWMGITVAGLHTALLLVNFILHFGNVRYETLLISLALSVSTILLLARGKNAINKIKL